MQYALARLGRRHELPTWGLIAIVYGGWLAVTWCYAVLPVWVVLPAGAWLIAWQMSLQHEVMHGHPTRHRRLNDALGTPPLSLWLPYHLYRRTHLRHHRDEYLTDPLEDPESNYLTDAEWRRLGRVRRAVFTLCNTFAGRVLLGPARAILVLLAGQAAAIRRGDATARRIWLRHGIAVAVLLAWVVGVCGIPLPAYIALFVYPGTALAMIRSLAEHRAAADPAGRTAIVERAPVLGLLFLYNNLHVLHHARPGLPWFELPSQYRLHREAIRRQTQGPVYDSYLHVARRYFLTPHHGARHPGPA